MKTRILIIEDSPSMARTYEGFLRKAGMETVVVPDVASGIEEVGRCDPHGVLLDLHLPDGSGLKLLRHLREEKIRVPVIAMTANGSMATAIEAMREGARDFLVKPFSGSRLVATIEQVFMRDDDDDVDQDIAPVASPIRKHARASQDPSTDLLGDSLPMQAVRKVIEAAAPSDASVMITGESGTGKELAAEAIHKNSRRADKPFVVLNCAAIPKDILESEVFGHVKGAFTGAVADRVGAAERADGGTLFLDELGEMDIGLQAKILRLVQQGTFTRVGDSRERRADIRFVAATNRNPSEAIARGQLREDLYFRLSVVPITMPPLRERGGDILTIANRYLASFSREEGKSFETFDDTARAWLASQGWRGNVRELMNIVRRAVILTEDGATLTARDLGGAPVSAAVPSAQATPTAEESGIIEPLHVAERRAIERALAITEGNIQEAARLLEINPSTIYRKRTAWMGGEG